ncbi:hypothetical protein [Bombilactobacillus thymidiniphilus]|uniref:DUF443 family protein n=1 Tax=Bombilactobacillus thymidiniphilus TaxID=2923363 RepID=A0ABY4PC28_9LACO|nr:hypothetical protein [Bombilactobacillus thymidiniphilus]UQS83061.1 hypothetical protein MOO47_04555 [Bombilactobacillus thymidiniphilus]
MSETDYRIHIVGRVNLQYYLVKYCNRHYLLDYGDPRQFANYGPLFFFNSNEQFTVYDVEADKEQFLRRAKHKYFNFKQAIISLLLFLISLLVLFPLLYNDNALKWYMYIFVIPSVTIGSVILLIAMLLKRTNKQLMDMPRYPSMQLELVSFKKTSILKKVSVVYGNYFLLWLSLNIYIYSCSNVLLIIFGFLYPYFIIFNRFIVCSLDRVGGKKSYQIK